MKVIDPFELETEKAFDVLENVEKLQREGKYIINLGIGQPDFKTPKHIVDAAIKSLKDGFHGYTPANGIFELRNSISNYYNKNFSQRIDPNRIIVVPGGKPTIFFAIKLFSGSKNEIICPDPGFPAYKSLVNFFGSNYLTYKLHEKKNFSFDVDEVLSLINKNTSLLIINNPQNPTGGLISESDIRKLVIGLEKFPHVSILSDEIYSRQLYDNKKMPSLINYPEIYDRLIVLDGFSKTYSMTGWRIGWSIWPEALVDHVVKLAINTYSCPNSFVQKSAIAALDGPQDFIEEMMSHFTKRRKLIVEGLNSFSSVSCKTPGGAFYVFPNISQTGMNGDEFAKKCLNEAGVAIVPGSGFGEQSKDFVRLSFANSYENIEKALEKIKKIL